VVEREEVELNEEKDCCCFRGWGSFVFLPVAPSPSHSRCGDFAAKIGVWPLCTPRQIRKAPRLDPHNTCAARICCQDCETGPCKIFDSLPCRDAPSCCLLLPSLQPPIREVSRRCRQEQICSVNYHFRIRVPFRQPRPAHPLLLIEKATPSV
jgi:hypothetical protein